MQFQSTTTRWTIGPPGTGKTEYLSKMAAQYAEEYDPDLVLILALTKASAVEIGSRATAIPEENKSTMHAACRKLVHQPKLPVSEQLRTSWAKRMPGFYLSPSTLGGRDPDDEREFMASMGQKKQDQDWYQMMDFLRHKMVPLDKWPPQLVPMWKAWSNWMTQNNAFDFTSWIEQVIESGGYPPHNAAVLLVDEAQDLSMLELTCIQAWSPHLEVIHLVGDPHQCIFDWRGAANMPMEDAKDEEVNVLEDSYRVPRVIHAMATRIMRMMNARQVDFFPRDHDGSLFHGPSLKSGVWHYRDLAIEEEKKGRTVMFLVTEGWMLQKLREALEQDGVMFWNPYQPESLRWNPLTAAQGRRGIPTHLRIRSFHEPWTPDSLLRFLPLIRAGVFEKGGMGRLLDLLSDDQLLMHEDVFPFLAEILKNEHIDGFLERDLVWLGQNCKRQDVRVRIEYYQRVLARYGEIPTKPCVILGTVHSVKGGQADHVVISPDVSGKFWALWQDTIEGGRDAMLRIFYTGVTRSRDALTVMAPGSRHHIPGVLV